MQLNPRNWLNEAINDISVSKILFREEKWNTVVYHSQQCAEKAIKALLFKLKQTPWGMLQVGYSNNISNY